MLTDHNERLIDHIFTIAALAILDGAKVRPCKYSTSARRLYMLDSPVEPLPIIIIYGRREYPTNVAVKSPAFTIQCRSSTAKIKRLQDLLEARLREDAGDDDV